MNKQYYVLSSLLLLIIVLFAACSAPAAGSREGLDDLRNQQKLRVAVTIVPQQTFVEAIAGDLAEVVVLVPPGYSPGNYAPTPMEMETLSKSQIYFSIGVPTEQPNILPRIEQLATDIKVVHLAEIVREVYPDREFAPGNRDAHIWMSPKRVQVIVGAMADEMAAIDPSNATTYLENAATYIDTLIDLDIELREVLQALESKSFIVYHPAFGYFADDYGMEMIALEKDGKDATPKELQRIIDHAKANNIKAIFYQKEIDSKQSESFAREINGVAKQLAPLSPDYVENMREMAEVFREVLQ